MKIRSDIILILITGLSFLFINAQGQDFESLSKQFPGEKAVMLNRTLEYNIKLKDGQPYVERHTQEQLEYLLGNAAVYMGEYGFSQSDFSQLISYDAYTRTVDGKKLKVTDFTTSTSKQDFIFYDDVKETSFNFPSVEPGAVGNLEVSWIEKDPHLLMPYFFSDYVPVVNSELKISVDDAISIKYRLMGLDTDKIKVTTEGKGRHVVYTFKFANCEANKRYPDAPDDSWYLPHVVFYIDHYKDESGNIIPYLSNADDLYRLNYSYIKSVNQTVDPGLKRIVDSLTMGETSAENKAKNIYNWVQQHIKYVAFEDGMGGFVPREGGAVCSRRFGE